MKNVFYRYYSCLVFVLLVSMDLHAHFLTCNRLHAPDYVGGIPFRHSYNAALSRAKFHHSAQDVLIAVGEDAIIEGKFTYGSFSKDLGDEFIEVWIDNCSDQLLRLGETITNQDGRTRLVISANYFPWTGGIFQIYQRVVGDGTFVASTLRVLPKGTRLAIFDIDGTLTLSDSELWNNIIDEDYIPTARQGADALTKFWYDANREVVYLSGRHYLLTSRSRLWLKSAGFAPGTLMVSQSIGGIWPSNSGVGTYKRERLQALLNSGFKIDAVYGNTTTDIYAYEQVNIDKSVTFIVGKHGGEEGTVALGKDFLSHVQDLISGGNDVL